MEYFAFYTLQDRLTLGAECYPLPLPKDAKRRRILQMDVVKQSFNSNVRSWVIH